MSLAKKKIIFVAGNFDKNGGKPSSVMGKLFLGILDEIGECDSLVSRNGGNISEIEGLLKQTRGKNFVFWFPNIDNKHNKHAKMVKEYNPITMLVTSKRNFAEYEFQDVVAHGLRYKSNLVLEISVNLDLDSKKFVGRVLDPLGNIFCDFTTDFFKIGQVLARRIEKLSEFTRMGSFSLKNKVVEVPNEEDFFNVTREVANVFDYLLPRPSFPERFLGNASFRCQKGFPSFRHGNLVFVSKRNIDKQYIGRDGFVATELSNGSLIEMKTGKKVLYYGDDKPSVDSPIQLSLYGILPKVNYMIHGHVYIKDAPFTKSNVPCGALQEVDEIMEALFEHYDGEDTEEFHLNLKGHGCLVGKGSVRLRDLEDIKFISRPIPELMESVEKEKENDNVV